MPFEQLPTDLLLDICVMLTVSEILILRQVCSRLYAMTQEQVIWLRLLNNDPARYHGLHSPKLEALAWRAQKLQEKWLAGDLSPAKVSRLYLPQSITWLRLVAGRWLFCTFSDNSTSGIGCWDITSTFDSHTGPIAIGYLPGRVQTVQLEVQPSRIAIALGLGPEISAIHIVTLERCSSSGSYLFTELACIKDVSHVLLLSGNIVGCAVRHGDNVPHLLDWTTQELIGISQLPGSLDAMDRQSVPHGMFLLDDILVVARLGGLEVYSVQDSIGFLKTIQTPVIWEVSACKPTSSLLRLMIISPRGIEAIDVNAEMLLEPGIKSLSTECLAPMPLCERRTRLSTPWYGLCAGSTGTRPLWISVASPPVGKSHRSRPLFVNVNTDDLRLIEWTPGTASDVALWAVPVVDFDETLGITVFGNCFGELAIYDHCGRGLLQCTDTELYAPTTTALSRVLPQSTIELSLPFGPQDDMPPEVIEAAVAQWSKANIAISGPRWRSKPDMEGYLRRADWQGFPCDWAWTLTHVYGFPGKVLPQAYKCEGEEGEDRLLFQVGNRIMMDNFFLTH
ncbi:F-box domain-containing protein [Mycena indigotica]|uniref:F-box domain-containing protein n=1 Tax=Mycena indigotica TaxID=2126181 RepID=A0A8H6SLC7_9AGAR|nr:F-box domain-containing protein [Mycena indigotica]KAF7301738.1 F-box domain-containing protein [Mycena indigotica]